MSVRSKMLELAILGELDEPIHGYQLRSRLSVALGPVRRLSFGSLYPALHRLSAAGLIDEVNSPQTSSLPERTPRRQVIYRLTDEGRAYLEEHLKEASTDDDSLGLTMRLMSKASPGTRLELLKKRRAQVLERREANRQASRSHDSWIRSRAQLDTSQDDSELDWLDRQISKLTKPSNSKKNKKNTNTKESS